jgi:hypothetical protein
MEAGHSSEMSVRIYPTARLQIPEGGDFKRHTFSASVFKKCKDYFELYCRIQGRVANVLSMGTAEELSQRRAVGELMNWGSEFQSRYGKDFSPLHVIQTSSEAHPASYPMGTGGSFLGVPQPGREADHSPPTSAEAKNIWIYTSTPPYIFTA